MLRSYCNIFGANYIYIVNSTFIFHLFYIEIDIIKGLVLRVINVNQYFMKLMLHVCLLSMGIYPNHDTCKQRDLQYVTKITLTDNCKIADEQFL